MRFLLSVVLVAFLATTAFAGQNPNLLIGLDANDPPDDTNRVDNPAAPFYVYVVFKDFGPGGGLLGAAFKFTRTFGGFKLAQNNLMGGLDFGDVEVNGWALTSGAECFMPDGTGIMIAAKVQYLWSAPGGTIQIIAHPVDGQSAADCNNDLDTWDIYSNFGVNEDAPASPVEASTWGSIKSLYR